jgi:hypothetical protein
MAGTIVLPTIAYKINPAFDRWPNEALLIGKMLAAFGELEFMTCNIAADTIGKRDQVLRALYRLRMTGARLDAADALLRAEFEKDHLSPEYLIGTGMVRHCLKIRNQYAHANWGDHHVYNRPVR